MGHGSGVQWRSNNGCQEPHDMVGDDRQVSTYNNYKTQEWSLTYSPKEGVDPFYGSNPS